MFVLSTSVDCLYFLGATTGSITNDNIIVCNGSAAFALEDPSFQRQNFKIIFATSTPTSLSSHNYQYWSTMEDAHWRTFQQPIALSVTNLRNPQGN
jgi:hypothetical protein